MLMTSQVATTRITRELRDTEDAIDKALACKAALLATMAQARLDTQAPAYSGHVAMMRLAKAEQSLMAARGDLIRAHDDLFKLGQERGDIIDGDKPPAGLDRFLEISEAA